MKERIIEVNKNWLKEEEALMMRLHCIISNAGLGPDRKESGYAWQLDSSNDWWAETRGGKLVLAYRYHEDRLNALADFCEVWLA